MWTCTRRNRIHVHDSQMNTFKKQDNRHAQQEHVEEDKCENIAAEARWKQKTEHRFNGELRTKTEYTGETERKESTT